MKTALITYFTGTGNSLRVSNLVMQKLTEKGYAVNLKKVQIGTEPARDNYDLNIFIYPVYAFRTPNIMVLYLNKLPKVPKNKAVVLSIAGDMFITYKNKKIRIPGYEGQASLQAKRILEKHGYDVFLTDVIGYPENFTGIINPPEIEEQNIIIEEGNEKLNEVLDKIINQERKTRRCHVLNQLWTWILGIGYEIVGRRTMGKIYVADDSCTSCAKCEKSCPALVIKMFKGKPIWNYNCEGCQRCINLCPTKAIQVSIVRSLIVIILFIFIPYHKFILKHLSIDAGIYSDLHILYIIEEGLWAIGFISLFYLLDKFIVLLECLPVIKYMFYFSYTKKFRRYLEPNFNP